MIDFAEEMEIGRQWNIFKVLQENNCQPRRLYQAKIKVGYRHFQTDKNLGEFITRRSTLKEL